LQKSPSAWGFALGPLAFAPDLQWPPAAGGSAPQSPPKPLSLRTPGYGTVSEYNDFVFVTFDSKAVTSISITFRLLLHCRISYTVKFKIFESI